MDRQIDCPDCKSSHTFPMPETAYVRFCGICNAEWDIRTMEEIYNEE